MTEGEALHEYSLAGGLERLVHMKESSQHVPRLRHGLHYYQAECQKLD